MWPHGPGGRRRLRRKLESQSDVAVIIREQISELAGCGIAPVQPAAVVVVNRDEPACRVLDRGAGNWERSSLIATRRSWLARASLGRPEGSAVSR